MNVDPKSLTEAVRLLRLSYRTTEIEIVACLAAGTDDDVVEYILRQAYAAIIEHQEFEKACAKAEAEAADIPPHELN